MALQVIRYVNGIKVDNLKNIIVNNEKFDNIFNTYKIEEISTQKTS